MMTCTRCQGLMLDEQMIDMEGDYGEMWGVSARCVNCGHRHDAVIQRHRHLHARSMTTLHPVTVQETYALPWGLEGEESLAA